jgi:hypothetical protein
VAGPSRPKRTKVRSAADVSGAVEAPRTVKAPSWWRERPPSTEPESSSAGDETEARSTMSRVPVSRKGKERAPVPVDEADADVLSSAVKRMGRAFHGVARGFAGMQAAMAEMGEAFEELGDALALHDFV